MQRISDEGLAGKLYFLIGIAPLRSAKSATWMRQHLFGTIIAEEIVKRMEGAADAEAEGKQVAIDLIAEFSEIAGVSGVHIMAPSHDKAIPDVIAGANALLRRAAADASRAPAAPEPNAPAFLWEQ